MVMDAVTLLIGGKSQSPGTGAWFERHEPVTGMLASRAAAATVDDAHEAADAATRAFPGWSETGPNHRRGLLQKAADVLEARAGDFIACMTSETGATAGWAAFNVTLAAGMLREAAAITTHITGQTIPSDKPGCLAMTVCQPAGVALGIAPWNAPIILSVRALATPLACGNTTVLKASEICPATHRLIGDVFTGAGFPDGAVNVITHAPADAGMIVNALIAIRQYAASVSPVPPRSAASSLKLRRAN
jgi:vanillin dehydrogenase